MEKLDVILLALFCFLMGATLVGLWVYWRGNIAKKAGGDPELVGVARLWRDRKTNRMVVEMEEKIYSSASELSAEQQAHLSSVASVLQTWLGEGAPGNALHPPAGLASAQLTPSEAIKQPAPPPPAVPPVEVKPVPARPLDAFNRAFTSGSKQSEPKFQSIATQINEIIRSHLPGSAFEAQGISLIEMPDQRVVVRVGSEEYAGVEAVPDPAVRAFIKSAVAEWEANTRGGIR